MEILNNIWFYVALGLGIGLIGNLLSVNLRKNMQKRKAMARARFVKDIRTEVRKYLEELKS